MMKNISCYYPFKWEGEGFPASQPEQDPMPFLQAFKCLMGKKVINRDSAPAVGEQCLTF
jgi:hypothetical protein